jgi:integrase
MLFSPLRLIATVAQRVYRKGKTMAKQRRGSGTIFLPTKTTKVWWCQYFLDGVPQRESTKETDKRKAGKYLQTRLSEAGSGNSLGAAAQKITVTEIVGDVIRRHKLDGNRSVEWDERRWELHLAPFFHATKQKDGSFTGGMKVKQVTTQLIDRYVEKRKQSEPAPSNGTINRELALLRSGFWLAYEATPRKVAFVPTFHFLEEKNVRKGFLKDDEYLRLAQECSNIGLWLRAMFEIYFTYGWRKNEPLKGMTVRMLDFEQRTITILDSKNGEGRVVTMTQKVFDLLKACCEGKNENDYVFTRPGGKPVRDFRKSWDNATEAAGVPNLTVHDLRRTGARNLRRAGVDRDVIMRIGGWKTDSVFRRYNIVDQKDIAEAMTKLENSSTIVQLSTNNGATEKPLGNQPVVSKSATIN